MRVEIEYQSLHARDSGERTAEPYLWPLFFRVDEAVYAAGLRAAVDEGELTADDLRTRGFEPEQLPATTEWLAGPGGSHGNVPPMGVEAPEVVAARAPMAMEA